MTSLTTNETRICRAVFKDAKTGAPLEGGGHANFYSGDTSVFVIEEVDDSSCRIAPVAPGSADVSVSVPYVFGGPLFKKVAPIVVTAAPDPDPVLSIEFDEPQPK